MFELWPTVAGSFEGRFYGGIFYENTAMEGWRAEKIQFSVPRGGGERGGAGDRGGGAGAWGMMAAAGRFGAV